MKCLFPRDSGIFLVTLRVLFIGLVLLLSWTGQKSSRCYSRLHIVLHNEIHSAVFDVTTCQSNFAQYGIASRRISGRSRLGRWERDCQSHQSLHCAFRCAKQYASDCSQWSEEVGPKTSTRMVASCSPHDSSLWNLSSWTLKSAPSLSLLESWRSSNGDYYHIYWTLNPNLQILYPGW